jgi:phenylpropionate dioxygenase-like ring-hydroxylating dioxygenase large terminal subunit
MLEDTLKNECWHLVCHRHELPAHNDFLRMPWRGEDLVVYNDSGELIVFDNLCPHRGTRFFVDRYGNAPALCPYHGWRYRNGQIHVARRERFTNCDLSSVRLNCFRTEWRGDFLFAAISPRSSLDDQLSGLGPLLESISKDIAGRHDFNEYPFECNWRVPVENALESYHVDMVHPTTLGSLKLSDGLDKYHGRNSVLWAELTNPRARRHLEALARFFSLSAQYKGYVSIYVFPYAMLTSTYGYSYALQHYLPDQDNNRTNFSSRLLVSKARDSESDEALKSFFDSTSQLNRKVFDEDHQICRRVSANALDWDRPSYFSSDEAKIAHFRESYRSFSTESSG